MHSGRLAERCVGRCPEIFEPSGHFSDTVHMEIEAKRHFVHSRPLGWRKVSSLRLVFLLSSEDPGPWDPRDPVAVEPSQCPSKFQELAEPEPLEAEAEIVSSAATRAARLLTICSTFVILAEQVATVWESVWTPFSNLDTLSKRGWQLRELYEHVVDFPPSYWRGYLSPQGQEENLQENQYSKKWQVEEIPACLFHR